MTNIEKLEQGLKALLKNDTDELGINFNSYKVFGLPLDYALKDKTFFNFISETEKAHTVDTQDVWEISSTAEEENGNCYLKQHAYSLVSLMTSLAVFEKDEALLKVLSHLEKQLLSKINPDTGFIGIAYKNNKWTISISEDKHVRTQKCQAENLTDALKESGIKFNNVLKPKN